MRTIGYLIVSLKEAYNNKEELDTGEEFIVNSTIENVGYVRRVCTVEVAPDNIILSKGDEVIVHHNIFRLRNGIKGELLESNFYLWDDLYFVPLQEVFMYKYDSEWVPLEPFCFVKPIEKEFEKTGTGFILNPSEESYKGRENRVGILEYPNKDLIKQGLKKGDKVLFSPYSEYEFEIDGETYYKMSTNDIVAKI